MRGQAQCVAAPPLNLFTTEIAKCLKRSYNDSTRSGYRIHAQVAGFGQQAMVLMVTDYSGLMGGCDTRIVSRGIYTTDLFLKEAVIMGCASAIIATRKIASTLSTYFWEPSKTT